MSRLSRPQTKHMSKRANRKTRIYFQCIRTVHKNHLVTSSNATIQKQRELQLNDNRKRKKLLVQLETGKLINALYTQIS